MTHSGTVARRLGRRPALDGLRALAVALVVAIHVGLLTAGYLGVDVFLPLSGFLITALLCEEWERSGVISLRRFYSRRARRLLPALAVLLTGYALVILLLHPFGPNWPLGRVLATTVLFVNNWISTLVPPHGSVLGALSPTWTLAEEGQFYLLWPPVLLFALRRGVGPRRVLVLLAAAMAGLVAAGVVARMVDPVYNAYTDPLARGAELLLGAAAAIAWRERLIPAALRHPLVGWGAVAGIAALVATARPPAPLWYLSGAALSALLIVNLLSRPQDAALPATAGTAWQRLRVVAPDTLRRVLRFRPLAATGRVSYGMYLFHVPIYYLVWTYLDLGSPLVYWPVVVALSIAAAAVSFKLVEAPVLRLRYRASRLRRPNSRPRFA